MTREAEGRGPTVEEAIQAALAELGVTEQLADVEIVKDPKGGFLGMGSQDPVVIVRTNEPESRADTEDDEPDEGDEPAPRAATRAIAPMSRVIPEGELEELEGQADAAADFLEELLGHMGIDAIAEPGEHGGHMYVDIVDGPEDDMALLIGRHGQTLDAIQELMRMVVNRRLDTRVRVIVDVQDYRKRREERLVENARHLADRVIDTGQEAELDPMNPFERKLVHDALADVEGVETGSRGEEPNRFVVITKI
ncbi:MAG: spoIIIJ-associated protein [Actinomycetota bacterium]|nr:spoIIIJ-associated protein [Actinomycetota bacterium]